MVDESKGAFSLLLADILIAILLRYIVLKIVCGSLQVLRINTTELSSFSLEKALPVNDVRETVVSFTAAFLISVSRRIFFFIHLFLAAL